MPVSRPRLNVPLRVLAVLSLLLIAVAPVLAAPADSGGGARIVLAQPEECDEITVKEDGDIVVDEVTLTEEQLALLDADVLAALQLAAHAAGVACVDVTMDAGEIAVELEISFCPASVGVDAEGTIALEGIEIDPALLDVEMLNLLRGAATAGVDACLSVFVTDNEVLVEVGVDACVTARANEDGSVTVLLGGVEILFPAGSIDDPANVLGRRIEVQIGLAIHASLARDEVELVAEVVEGLDNCVQGRPGVGEVRIDKGFDADGDRGTFGDLEAGPGWTFDFAISSGEVVDRFPTTDEDGQAYFAYTTEEAAPVLTIGEELREGYRLLEPPHCVDQSGDELAYEVAGAQITFTARADGSYICFFLNTPAGPEPTPTVTTAPTAAPTGGQAPTSNRPTITLPPTDVPGSATSSLLNSSPLVFVTLGLVVSGTLLLTLSYGRKR